MTALDDAWHELGDIAGKVAALDYDLFERIGPACERLVAAAKADNERRWMEEERLAPEGWRIITVRTPQRVLLWQGFSGTWWEGDTPFPSLHEAVDHVHVDGENVPGCRSRS